MRMKEYKVLQKSHINHLKDDSAIPCLVECLQG